MSDKVSLSEILNSDKGLFVNKQVLKPNYTLKGINEILHRNDEIRTYFEYLKDIFCGVSPSNIFVYGKPGLGKTIITKWVLEEIKKETENRDIKLCVIDINCDGSETAHAILQDINEGLPSPKNEKKRNIVNSKAKQIKYFEYLVNNYEGIILIVLDEFDKAVNPEIINKIIRTESVLSNQYPCVICITNELQLRDRFPPHLKSTLCENTLIINPYNAEQLIDIVKARMEMALKPDATAEIVAPLCAALAAQEHGDARRAIDLLKVSGEIAELRGKVCIEEQDVIDAKEKIEVDRVIEVVKTLPIQSKTALLACIYIFDSGNENTTNNIYNAYRMLCDAIGIDTLTQRRMTDLLGELDQLGIIEGTIVFQGRYGRKKQITKITSKEHALETLYQDFRLKTIAYIPSSNFFNTSVIRW